MPTDSECSLLAEYSVQTIFKTAMMFYFIFIYFYSFFWGGGGGLAYLPTLRNEKEESSKIKQNHVILTKSMHPECAP